MTRISVQLPYAEKESFMKIAVKNDMSMSQLLRWFIRSVNENSGGFTIEIKK